MYHPEGDTHAVPFPVAVSMMTHIPLFQILLYTKRLLEYSNC